MSEAPAVETKELLKIAFERASQINTYWNLLIVVVIGLLGILGTGKAFADTVVIKALMSVGFAVFATSNLAAILDLIDQRSALDALIRKQDPNGELGGILKPLKPYPTSWYTVFHVAMDTIVLSAMWLVPWHELQSAGGV